MAFCDENRHAQFKRYIQNGPVKSPNLPSEIGMAKIAQIAKWSPYRTLFE